METSRRILVYDADCSMCTRLSRLAVRPWLVGDAERRPHDAFAGEEARRLEAAGIRNELAVLDPGTGEIRSGYDGIVWLLRGGRLSWLAPLLSFGPLRWLLRHDYRLVAYNRRIFAPPRRAAACACDPDVHVGYRWAFILVALLWTGLFAALGGGLFWTEQAFLAKAPAPGGAPPGTWWWGAIVIAGWIAIAPLALRLPSPRGLDYLGHTAWIFAAMVLPLLLAVFVGVGAAVLTALLGGSLLPDAWLFSPGVPLGFGIVAWTLALPIAVGCCLWRLPRLGLGMPAAALVGLVAWLLPTALLLLLAPLGSRGL